MNQSALSMFQPILPPPPVQRTPVVCPVCRETTPANEMKAYGRCESCYTEPRVGMPVNVAKPKRYRAPRADD